VTINLGSVEIDKETWARCKAHGYTRDDIRSVIVQNGEESLMSALDSTMFCEKCGAVATNGGDSCDHKWVQK